jgi:4a-hydroxytetrahydrobiopterin dehydratase
MSEQGWQAFLRADGIEDWVMLHGGPTAVFRVGSLQEAARLALALAAKPDAIDLAFWRAVLGYRSLHEDNCADPLGQGSTVWMQELDPNRPLRHAMHIDVSVSRAEAETRLRAAVDAGGRIVDDSAAPSAWILADRSGNKVCIAAWPDGAEAAGP